MRLSDRRLAGSEILRNMIPPEAMVILATIGLTPDQAAQVARVISLVESSTSAEMQAQRQRNAERQARWRGRHKGEDVTQHNVTETLCNVTKRNITATKESSPYDPLKENISPQMMVKPSSAPQGDRRRGTRLAEDWLPSEALFAKGAEKGLSRAEVLEI